MKRANRNIKWINDYCRIPEGKFVGQPVKLRPWQCFEIRKIYGNRAGTRRAIISFGRKNGKTALAAFLLLLHLCGPEHRPNSNLYSAAQSREQAAILFGLAAKCVRMSPDLNAVVIIRDNAKQLACAELGTLYRALSAEASTAYGLSPAFIVHDELGQIRGPSSQLYEALETATAAQGNPLSLIISTQAPNPGDLLSILIDDAATGADPRVTLSLYSAPDDADPFTIKTIKMANPAFGDFQNAEEVLAMAEDARRMPSREPEYRNLILNQRVEMYAPFVSRSVWAECSAAPSDLEGLEVFLGLDLSAVSDLTAKVAVGRREGVWQIHPTFWLPGDGLRERARLDRVPYDVWRRDGFLETTPGRTVEYQFVAETLFQDCARWNVRKIAFDRWGYKHLKPWLLQAGFRPDQVDEADKGKALFEPFGQGYQSMSPAIRTVEELVKDRRLAHGNHPVLTMCAANAVVVSDPAGNRKLDKVRASGRIDGMVALAMALSVAITTVSEPPKEYQLIFA